MTDNNVGVKFWTYGGPGNLEAIKRPLDLKVTEYKASHDLSDKELTASIKKALHLNSQQQIENIKEIGVSISGSHTRIAVAREGKLEPDIAILDSAENGDQAQNIRVLKDILDFVAKKAKQSQEINLHFNISGFSVYENGDCLTQNAQGFQKRSPQPFTYMRSRPSEDPDYEAPDYSFYLPNAPRYIAPEGTHADVKVPVYQYFLSDLVDLGYTDQYNDEANSCDLNQCIRPYKVSVMNDTCTAARTALEFYNQTFDTQSSFAMVLGTGHNTGLVQDPSYSTNNESGHIPFPKTSKAYKLLEAGKDLVQTDTMTYEQLFSAGDKKRLRGASWIYALMKEISSSSRKLTKAITPIESFLGLEKNSLTQLMSSSSSFTKKSQGHYFSSKEIVSMAEQGDELANTVLTAIFKEIAKTNKREFSQQLKGNTLLAITGSYGVDVLTRLPEIRKEFLNILGVPEERLFLHAIGGDDGLAQNLVDRAN